jgi:molybdopterin-guanine dinucleotide biosynthesis protein A
MITSTAGFVLVGGRSSRFGRDKALLDWGGRPLVLHIAEQVREAAGSVTLVGTPERYGHLGLTVLPDRGPPQCGPLGGLLAALDHTTADWNLVVACDMPRLTPDFLAGLLEEAAARDHDVLLPQDSQGRPEPLCAVYHRRCRAAIEAALSAGVRKMTDAFAAVRVSPLAGLDDRVFANLNRPGDLASAEPWKESAQK